MMTTSSTGIATEQERDLAGLASPWDMAVRQFRYWLVNYRRTWRGSAYTSFLEPLLYLGSIGLGLGALVNKHGTAALGGVSYLSFLAPGLLAGAAMQTAIGESTYPVLGSVKWRPTYRAAVNSPVRPQDLMHGHLLFTTMRLAMNSAAFLAVMAAFGTLHSPWAAAALPAALLTGLAFAAPIEAWAITLTKDSPFAYLFRFGMIPMFLFSGTFFPVTQLPVWARPVAYVTPLWHGAALCRSLTLGRIPVLESLGHVAFLAALALAGLYAGGITYRRRLSV
jgi:lipooligosaccharide transport system permease protein